MPTTSHPSSHHSVTPLHPHVAPSPPVALLLSPSSLTPCGLPVFSPKLQSIISASLGAAFSRPTSCGSPSSTAQNAPSTPPIQDRQPKKPKRGLRSVTHQAGLLPITCRPHSCDTPCSVLNGKGSGARVHKLKPQAL